jgi:putative acetyltransferase
MPLTLRPAILADAEAITAVFEHAVTTLGPQYYTPDQVAAWAQSLRGSDRLQAWLQEGTLWVADDSDRILGFVGLAPDGLITMLYVHGDHGRQGIGSQLLRHALDTAIALGLSDCRAEASALSCPLFETFGFSIVGCETVTRSGVAFQRTLLRYPLPSVSR